MNPLRVLIVDDEELARLRLRGLVNDCVDPKTSVVGEAANATQAMAWLGARLRCAAARRPDARP
jgi:two-component system response regulator AlgR